MSCRFWFRAILVAPFIAGCFHFIAPTTVRADHSPAVFGGGSGGPINTIPGTLLERGGVAMSYRYDCLDLRQFTDQQLLDFEAAGLDAHSANATLIHFATLAYGMTENLTVAIRQPYFSQINIREPDGAGGVDSLGSSSGFGDIQLFAFRKLFQSEERKLFISGLVGFDVPTGLTTNRTHNDDLFETEHQPGSGSLDPIIGLNITKNFENFSFHSSISRVFNTPGSQETTLGNVFNYNTAFVYRLTGQNVRRPSYRSTATAYQDPLRSSIVPVSYHEEDHHDHGSHSHGAGHHHGDHNHGPLLDLICEFNGVDQNRHVTAGVINESSGGQLVYISPGIRLTLFEHWSTFIQGGFPISQRVNGANHMVDSRFTLGTAYFY